MRSAIYLAIGAFAAFAAAQGSTENAFLNPPGGYQFAAGKPTELSWTPSTDGTVTLKLQKGENTTPQDGIVIAGMLYIHPPTFFNRVRVAEKERDFFITFSIISNKQYSPCSRHPQ